MPVARWGPRVLALAAVALSTLALATGAAHQPEKKTEKKTTTQNDVYFEGHPAEWVCYDAPYKLKVCYTATENLRITVSHHGKSITPAYHDVPAGSDCVEFEIDYDGDTTIEEFVATLHSRTDVKDIKATYSRSPLCFLKGMMVAVPKVKESGPPVDLPAGVRLADRTDAWKGKQVPVGFHHGEFKRVGGYIHGGQVRFWVQGRFKKGAARMEYDRAATLVQKPTGDGKWKADWFHVVPEPLKGQPLPSGEEPMTIVLVALLDGKGRVLEVRPYW